MGYRRSLGGYRRVPAFLLKGLKRPGTTWLSLEQKSVSVSGMASLAAAKSAWCRRPAGIQDLPRNKQDANRVRIRVAGYTHQNGFLEALPPDLRREASICESHGTGSASFEEIRTCINLDPKERVRLFTLVLAVVKPGLANGVGWR
jgi:hypothetical protein